MMIRLGPIGVYAVLTGRVVENENGSMDIYIETRDKSMVGNLFLTTEEVGILRTRRVRKVNNDPRRRERSVKDVVGRDR